MMYSTISGSRGDQNCLLNEALFDDESIVYAAFSGAKTNVQNLIRSLRKGRQARFAWHDRGLLSHRYKGTSFLKSMTQPLKTAFGLMGVCYHSAAAAEGVLSLHFYLISRSKRPNYEVFYRYLNKGSKTPMLPEWSSYLWMCGLKDAWIRPLPHFGPINGWRVDIDDADIQKHIVEGLASEAISGLTLVSALSKQADNKNNPA